MEAEEEDVAVGVAAAEDAVARPSNQLLQLTLDSAKAFATAKSSSASSAAEHRR